MPLPVFVGALGRNGKPGAATAAPARVAAGAPERRLGKVGNLQGEKEQGHDHWLASHCQMYLPTFEPDDFDEDKSDVGADEALV